VDRNIICRPFAPDQIRTRPGRNGQQLSYVSTHAVIARLNEGCEAWDFEIVEHSVHNDEVIVLGKLVADGVTKSAFGGSAITIDPQGRVVVSLADDLKAAASDSLKKCASLLGVGLELYGAPPAKPAARQNGAANSNASNGGNGNGADPADRITSKQLAAIHAACRRLEVSKDDLLELVNERFHRPKLEYLTKAEASSLLDHFNSVGRAANQ